MSRRVDKKDIDEQFEAFLKESLSTTDESLESNRVDWTGKGQKSAVKSRDKTEQPWWMAGSTGQETDDLVGLSGTGKSFLKKKTEPAELSKKTFNVKIPAESYELSEDSLDTNYMKAKQGAEKTPVPHLSLDTSTTYTDPQTLDVHVPGMDTLDEMKDKESFFQNLEDGDESLDYHKLNQDLDQSDTLYPRLSQTGQRASPASNKLDNNKPSMLDNVALLDSLDRTLGTTDYAARDLADGIGDRGARYGDDGRDIGPDHRFASGALGTGTLVTADTSEMAALREAYQKAAHGSSGAVSRDQKEPLGTLKSDVSATNQVSDEAGTRDTEHGSFGLRIIGPGRSDGQSRTVDDILREVAEIDDKVQSLREPSPKDEADGGAVGHVDHDPEDKPGGGMAQRLAHDDYDVVRVIDHSPDPKSKMTRQQTTGVKPAPRRLFYDDLPKPETGGKVEDDDNDDNDEIERLLGRKSWDKPRPSPRPAISSRDTADTKPAELEKEIQEQEKLIQGYQQENEKLYNELKQRRLLNKETENKLLGENQSLATEVMKLRTELSRQEMELKKRSAVPVPSPRRVPMSRGENKHDAVRIDRLETDLERAKSRVLELEESLDVHDRCKRDLETQIRKLVKERGGLETVDGRQSLIEYGAKMNELEAKAKADHAADARRILDLERQVKELENIVRKRNVDNLSSVMHGAANEAARETPIVKALENQVRFLEEELASKEKEHKKEMILLEEKFTVKNNQVDFTEDQDRQSPSLKDRPHTHTVALQKELESVRKRTKKMLSEKDAEIDRIQRELNSLKSKYAAEEKRLLLRAQDSQTEHESRVKALQKELVEKDQRILSLEGDVRKLKTEKDLMVIDSALRQDHLQKESTEQQERKNKKTAPQKQYEPNNFKGLHIDEVVKENKSLKLQVERCELECNQLRVDLSKALAEKESALRKMQEHCDEQISSMKKSHQQEIETLVTKHAMHHSTSKVGELQAKLETQELMLSHLKEQYADARHKADQLSVLKIREAALQAQVQQLLQDLREARRNHTPEMVHYDELLNQIRDLKSRQSLRENDLEQIIDKNKRLAVASLEKENAKWRKIVEAKNEDLRRFREELDSLLAVLKELQRQGVVMPNYNLKSVH